jgi:hypothetical protein
LSRLIDSEIKSPLSRNVLFGNLQNGGKVTVIVKDDHIDFVINPTDKSVVIATEEVTDDRSENQDNQ